MSGVQMGPGATALTLIFLAGQRLREGSREGHDGALGGRIVQQVVTPAIGGHRRCVDNGAACAQMGNAALVMKNMRIDIGAKGALELARRDALADSLARAARRRC